MFRSGLDPSPFRPAYSSLSALAPPFNSGYAHSDHSYPFSYPPDTSSFSSVGLIPPSPSFDSYSCCYPPAPSSFGANMGSLEPDFCGAGLFQRDGSYGGDYGRSSAWMDPQASWDPLMSEKGHYGSECSDWLAKKRPSVFEDNARPAYPGALLLGQTGMAEGVLKLPHQFAVTERDNVFEFHSSSRGLMDEHVSPSTASIFSSSNHMFVSPATSSEYNSIPRNEHSTVQDRILFDLNDNYTHQPTEQSFSFLQPYTGGNDWYTKTSSAPNDVKEPPYLPGYLTPVQIGCSSDNELVAGKSTQCAVDIPDLRTGKMRNSDSLTANSVSAEPVISLQTFLETLDHHNLAVDSPCWKGASGSQLSPFSAVEAPEPGFVTKESERSNDLQHNKNDLLNIVHSESMPSAKQEVNLISNENSKHSLCSLVDLSVFLDLQNAHQKANDGCKAKSSGLDNGNEQGSKVVGGCSNKSVSQGDCEPMNSNGKSVVSEISHVANESSILERIVDTEKDLVDSVKDRTYGFDSCVGGQAVNASKLSVPVCIAETFGSFDSIGNFSPSENNVQLLIKAMHGLSEVLLYTDCIDSSELKEHDNKLLQSIIWNLERFNLKSKKGKSKGSSHISVMDSAVADFQLLKVDGASMSNDRTRCNASMEMQSSRCGLGDNLLDKSVPTSGTTASIADYMAHALDKINIENPGQEENPQTKFYKKLWIDAEIASCAVKYELQRLRMNAEIENHKNKAKESLAASYLSAKPAEFPRTLSRDSLHLLDVIEGKVDDVKESMCHDVGKLEDDTKSCCDINSHQAFPSTIAGEIDSSIMARFHILKERLDKPTADYVGDHDAMGTVDIAMQNKDGISTHLFDSTDNTEPKSLEMMLAESGAKLKKGQHASAELRGASPASKGRSDVSHFSESHNEAATTIFHADRSINQSYAPSIKGNQSSVGYDSCSSEWEHVLDEEFTLV